MKAPATLQQRIATTIAGNTVVEATKQIMEIIIADREYYTHRAGVDARKEQREKVKSMRQTIQNWELERQRSQQQHNLELKRIHEKTLMLLEYHKAHVRANHSSQRFKRFNN